jgi:hypothetical protein
MVQNANNNQTSTLPTFYNSSFSNFHGQNTYSKFTGDNSFANNISASISSSNGYLSPPPPTFSNINSSISSSEISRGDPSSLSFNQNEKLTNQSVLNAITTAVNNHMSPMATVNNKRKRLVERPYGESLTSVEAFQKVQEKENKRKKQKTNSTNSTRKPTRTTKKTAASSRKKK